MLHGTLLAESLRIGAQLDVPGLRLARISRADVSASATGNQPTTWTFIEFEADSGIADQLARALSRSLLPEGGWYADFTVDTDHVVVFAGKVFRYRRGDAAGRAAPIEYGKAMGVPAHQLDWGK